MVSPGVWQDTYLQAGVRHTWLLGQGILSRNFSRKKRKGLPIKMVAEPELWSWLLACVMSSRHLSRINKGGTARIRSGCVCRVWTAGPRGQYLVEDEVYPNMCWREGLVYSSQW